MSKLKFALKASVKHWKWNKAHPLSAHIRSDTCPLCRYCGETKGGLTACERCPIYERTGLKSCNGGPWSQARDALYPYRGNPTLENLRTWERACDQMIKFLRSLGPEVVQLEKKEKAEKAKERRR